MSKILEDEQGKRFIIKNEAEPPENVISARVDDLDRHWVIWSKGVPEDWLFVES